MRSKRIIWKTHDCRGRESLKEGGRQRAQGESRERILGNLQCHPSFGFQWQWTKDSIVGRHVAWEKTVWRASKQNVGDGEWITLAWWGRLSHREGILLEDQILHPRETSSKGVSHILFTCSWQVTFLDRSHRHLGKWHHENRRRSHWGSLKVLQSHWKLICPCDDGRHWTLIFLPCYFLKKELQKYSCRMALA